MKVNIVFCSDAVLVSLGLSHVLFSPHSLHLRSSVSTIVQKINASLADGSLSSRRKLVNTLYNYYNNICALSIFIDFKDYYGDPVYPTDESSDGLLTTLAWVCTVPFESVLYLNNWKCVTFQFIYWDFLHQYRYAVILFVGHISILIKHLCFRPNYFTCV